MTNCDVDLKLMDNGSWISSRARQAEAGLVFVANTYGFWKLASKLTFHPMIQTIIHFPG